MRFFVIPQVYTIIMFGTSIFLWRFLRPIPIMPGTPVCLQHPFVMLEFLSLLSTAIMWIITLPIFLYSLVKGRIAKTREHAFVVSLALATIIVAISGSKVFSETIPYPPTRGLPSVQLDPFGQVYGIGVVYCEGLWIFWTIFIYCPERLVKRAHAKIDMRKKVIIMGIVLNAIGPMFGWGIKCIFLN